jgi:hypothetical protein
MATLVLGAIGGRAFGRVGAAAGAALGGLIDGRGKRREVGRLADLTVQGASYGEPLPLLFGAMRVAGTVIWSSGLIETATKSGGGKKSGGRTTTYSYAASFAVALASRRIVRAGRIWADGKLLRGAGGEVYAPVGAIRVHDGSEGQAVDPLISAAEGPGGTPAYRGTAYVVFEQMQLADFANRVPTITVEVIADDGAVGVGAVAAELSGAAGVTATAGSGAALAGFGWSGGPVRSALETLDALGPLLAVDDGATMTLGGSGGGALSATTALVGDSGGTEAARRETVDSLPGAVSLGYADPARDYQAGLQRAWRGSGSAVEHRDVPAALSAAQAKQAAERMLADGWRARARRTVTLGWADLAVQPGDALTLPDGSSWRVAGVTVEGLRPTADLELLRPPPRVALPPGSSGRAIIDVDAPQGATVLHLLDLPPLSDGAPTTARLWLAAAGASAGWRRAELLASVDGGASYASVGVSGGVTMGIATGVLGAGPCDRWDRRNTVEVELLGEAMALESRSAAAVLAGANAVLIGDEIVQFRTATATGPRRFRLSELLRGRRGTERAVAGHAVGDRVVMLDAGDLVAYDAAASAVGGTLKFKAAGPADSVAAVVPVDVTLVGRALGPPSPVHLRAVTDGAGGVRFSWVRRSRAGFDWIDGPVPLGETAESYTVEILVGAAVVRATTVTAPAFVYGAAMRASDGTAAAVTLTLKVAQGGAAGPGDAAEQQFSLSA